mgnify:CR=1 FL=1
MVVLKSCTNTLCKSLYVCVFVRVNTFQMNFLRLSIFHLLFSKNSKNFARSLGCAYCNAVFYSKVHVVLLIINGGASLFTFFEKIESFESALVIDWMYCNVVSYDSPSLTAHAYNH